VDAVDSQNVFMAARIKETSTSQIAVNFDGWTNKWDQIFYKSSKDVRPFRSTTTGYGGNANNAFRPEASFSFEEINLHRTKI
jgi:hypothetical protein